MKYQYTFLFLLMFNQLGITQELSYVYDENNQWTINTIGQAVFNPFSSPINQGFNNGVYWIEIKSSTHDANIFQISNNHISDVSAYSNGGILPQTPSHRFVTFDFSEQNYPIYLRIVAKKEAFIPIRSFNHDDFLKHEQFQMLIVGLFYGFALMIIIVNLFYYFNFHDKSFLFYALFLMTVIFSFGHRDGFLQILGMPKNITDYTEIFSHTLIGFVGTFFAVDYLQLKQNFPKFIYSLYFVVLVSLCFSVCYLITDKFWCYILADLFIYYVFIGCWFVSLLLFKKYTYAGYFCVAYGLLVAVVFAFFIAPLFAIKQFNIDDNVLKIGSYVEMLIITFAVVARMRVLQDENQQMHDEIMAYTQQLNALSQGLEQSQKTNVDYREKFDLSSRENEILELITQNKSNKEIARELFISVNTVKYHIKKLYQKLHIQNRKQVKSILKPS